MAEWTKASDCYQRLKNAAESGDTNVLYYLIKEDPYILEHIDKVPFVDTPLHAASRVGHVDFVREIMRWKPSFAKKPNQDGLYPIHLAAIEGQFEVLRALLRSDIGLARLQGREGKTPLHYAAERGDLLLLNTILLACPQSMQDVTDRSETALHIAIKFSNCDAFKILLTNIRTAYHEGSAKTEKSILNFQNEDGNTVLHIAVMMNQPQLVKRLVEVKVELNKKNLESLTAMDLLAQVEGENAQVMRKTLRKAGALISSEVPAETCHILTSTLPKWHRRTIYYIRYNKNMSTETRSLLLVVTVLIATINYHAAIAPPSRKNDNKNISLVLNFTANSLNPNVIHCSLNHTSTNSFPTSDILFWTSNIAGLTSSMLLVVLLVPGKYVLSLMNIPLFCFGYCYIVTTSISGSQFWFLITALLWSLLSYVLSRLRKVRRRIKTRKKQLSLVHESEELRKYFS